MSVITQAHLRRDDAAQATLAGLLTSASVDDGAHRLIWTLFGGRPLESRPFLYRETGPARFLIVSTTPPSDPANLWRLDTKSYPPAFAAGQRLAFSVRLSATRSIRSWARGRGRRVSVLDPNGRAGRDQGELVLQWLFAREQGLGVAFDRASCWADGVRRLALPRGEAAPIPLSSADCHGVLRVTQPAALGGVAMRGLGRAKAYGCGLLLLRPAGAVDGVQG